MKHFVNPNKIIEAYISEPYENCGESWDMGNTHGWEIILITSYDSDVRPIRVVFPQESEIDAINKLIELGLKPIS